MAGQICVAGVALVCAVTMLFTPQSSAQTASKAAGKPYVLMVTSLDPPLEKLTDA